MCPRRTFSPGIREAVHASESKRYRSVKPSYYVTWNQDNSLIILCAWIVNILLVNEIELCLATLQSR